MKALIETAQRRTEQVFLIGLELKSRPSWDLEDSLTELGELARSAGADILGSGIQRLEAPMASTFIGRGKAETFASNCREQGVDTVIFDDELSPAQARNLERIFECKILDRTSLILDIFAMRARSREGKLQVELAQLHHLLPRLTRYWSHLSRQKGGIGMRGDGETQLETDRRRVQERIIRIAHALDEVRRHRGTQRDGRKRHRWPLASIVGYTNAGKSTLLNALTGASALSEDKLFATLDPTTRRLRLPTNQNVLLTDTVGFIRKLPHRLVESFKATLEEVVEADLLVHVVDVSHPTARDQIEAVNVVLEEIGAGDKPTLMVFNKIDRLVHPELLRQFLDRFPNGVPVSARDSTGLDSLLSGIGTQLRPERTALELHIPHHESALIARLHAVGQVLKQEYEGDTARFLARIPPHHCREFAHYIVRGPNGHAVLGEGGHGRIGESAGA